KKLGAKEHINFHIRKYFYQKSTLFCTNTPKLCRFLVGFSLFFASKAILFLFKNAKSYRQIILF
ncbi:MAG: hypothetical protein ACFNJR_08780, partial [Segatella oulorum]|uniref:hypothetical protein n=1 Tax=Segatella oulorum TaxID=28136 RepID=UPI0036111AC3